MKIKLNSHGTEGSLLMITVITLFVLTVTAGSYMFMLQNDNLFVARDQAWNRALVVAESGLEEALAHMNRGGATMTPQSFLGDTWTASGTNYSMTRSDLYGGTYSVVISGSGGFATITSTGMVTAPLSGATLRRVVQVKTPFSSGYMVGIASLTTITGNGNNVTTDSYDSRDTNDFPGGVYNAAHRQDHGDIATLEDAGGAFSLGNANIMGTVHTAPGGTISQVSIGPNGSVGDVPFVTGGGTGFENSSFFKDDFNDNFPDVAVPYTGGTAPTTNALSSGDYYVGGNFTGNLTVGSYQFVELYVTGTFNASSITIQQGGTICLFVGGSTAAFGNINNGGNAENFRYFGLPGNTKISFSGNDAYVGTIYAPEASIKLSGGGNDTMDYQGAMVVRQLTVDGHFNLHYDQNLQNETIPGTFVPTNWVELASSVTQ